MFHSWIHKCLKKQLDPDPHLENQLEPNPQKTIADPQPCFRAHEKILTSRIFKAVYLQTD